MKFRPLLALIGILSTSSLTASEPFAKPAHAGKQPVIVFVHGAWAGGWPVIIMEADHNPHWRKPEALAELLLGIP